MTSDEISENELMEITLKNGYILGNNFFNNWIAPNYNEPFLFYHNTVSLETSLILHVWGSVPKNQNLPQYIFKGKLILTVNSIFSIIFALIEIQNSCIAKQRCTERSSILFFIILNNLYFFQATTDQFLNLFNGPNH